MDNAVKVGLVFPRSGQELLVTIPRAHAERLGVSDSSARQIGANSSTAARLSTETPRHAQ